MGINIINEYPIPEFRMKFAEIEAKIANLEKENATMMAHAIERDGDNALFVSGETGAPHVYPYSGENAVDSARAAEIRELALGFAVQASIDEGPQTIVAAARKFEEYLKG